MRNKNTYDLSLEAAIKAKARREGLAEFGYRLQVDSAQTYWRKKMNDFKEQRIMAELRQ